MNFFIFFYYSSKFFLFTFQFFLNVLWVFHAFFIFFFVIVLVFSKLDFISFGGCCGFFVQNSEKIYNEKKCEYTITYKNFFLKII
jgi:hypothetical protein